MSHFDPTELQELVLHDNGLLGKFPSELGRLSKLEVLSAGGQNLLDGFSIASEIVALAADGLLEAFHATFLDFSGPIPDPFCELDSLSICVHLDGGNRPCYCSCDLTPCATNTTANQEDIV